MRMSKGLIATGLVLAVGTAAAVWWFLLRPDSPTPDDTGIQVPHVHFRDVTETAGIRFRHVNGAFGKKLLPETMGSGVAVLDYDNDGKQDILFVNSCYWPGHEERDQPAPTLALYRNKGDGTFEDVTEAAGLKITMYGMGVTAGDYDNDGFIDVFITGVGGNRLFHNVSDGNGGRKFVEAKDAGVTGPGGWPAGGDILGHGEPIAYSSSATWLDYDGDGLLDLFICNYVVWSPKDDLASPFTLPGVGRAYGPPTYFGPTQCFLYRNLGGGKFEDVSEKAGIQVVDERTGKPVAKALGVIACDVDGDGWPDLFVANDTERNFFFHNEPVDRDDPTKGRRFVEIGKKSGVAFAGASARGAMGIDWVEYRPDSPALVIVNFAGEPNTLLRRDNASKLLFSDVAAAEGVARPSEALLKFGAFFFDYDLDGRPDLLTCNGHLEPDIGKVQKQASHAQPAQLFWNSGNKARCFEPVTQEQAGPDLFRPLVGRGCAFGDFTGTGRLDVILTANNGPARLLRNEGGTGNHWIRLELVGDGVRSNRSAIGAQVTVEAGGLTQRREVLAGRGYLSQSELPLTFGLGKCATIDRITIQWPGRDAGPATVLTKVPVDQSRRVVQGEEKQ
jgi:enediyne biosynthesis protein E4